MVMKNRNMVYNVNYNHVPTEASALHGLASLTMLPLNSMWTKTPVTLDSAINPWRHFYPPRSNTLELKRQILEKDPCKDREPILPADPRHWTREDVAQWLDYVTKSHHLPSVHLDRFMMNGKALCLMSIEMFVNRVPLGGKLLYKDFQLRLSKALYA